jgi:hypothetical protein
MKWRATSMRSGARRGSTWQFQLEARNEMASY